MPQVPLAKRQVATTALPGARRQAAETPESRGAGLQQAKERTGQQIGQLGAQIAEVAISERQRLIDEERKKADQVALLNAQNRLDQFELQRLHDPKTGALNTHGQAAFTLPESIDEDYDKLAGEIQASLGSDVQRLGFAKLSQDRRQNIALNVRRHVSNEMDAFDKSETDGQVANASNLAALNAHDEVRVGMELNNGVRAIVGYGSRHGIPDDQVQKQINGFLSDSHIGVIENLVASKEPQKARDYFTAAKKVDEIAGDKIDDIERLLKVGATKKQAQIESDKILAAGGTVAEQRQKAKAIDDPDVRDEALGYIEHEADVKDKAQRDADENASKGAYDIVDKTKSIQGISAKTWANFTGPQRNALRDYADALAKGLPIKTDYTTYYALRAMASTAPGTKLPDGRAPLNSNDFVREDLTKYRNALSDTDYKQMIDLQASIREGDQKKTDSLQLGYLTSGQIVDGVLSGAGYDTSPAPGADADAVYRFRAAVDKQVAAQEQAAGKKISNADIKDIADELITRVTLQKGTYGGFFTSAPFYDVTKRIVDVTLQDMSTEMRSQAAEWLRSKGQPVSDETMLNAFRRLLLVQSQQQKQK